VEALASGEVAVAVDDDGSPGKVVFVVDVMTGEQRNILQSNLTAIWHSSINESGSESWLHSGFIYGQHLFDLDYGSGSNVNWASDVSLEYDNESYSVVAKEMPLWKHVSSSADADIFVSAQGRYDKVRSSSFTASYKKDVNIHGSFSTADNGVCMVIGGCYDYVREPDWRGMKTFDRQYCGDFNASWDVHESFGSMSTGSRFSEASHDPIRSNSLSLMETLSNVRYGNSSYTVSTFFLSQKESEQDAHQVNITSAGRYKGDGLNKW
jgi:hypothetical protein